MNRNSGGMLALLIVASMLARSSGSRQEGSAQPGAGRAVQTPGNGKKPPRSGSSSANPWDGSTVPPDPRCFLIRPIAAFYGSQEPVPSGAFLDAYADVPKGCDPHPAA